MKERLVSVVTGGTGFVGSHLVDLLIAKGHKVKVIARSTSSKKWLEGKDIEIADCGLFDKEKLVQVVKDADYVFHVAGVVKAKEWEYYLKGNVETTKNILDAVSEGNPSIKKVVVVSSFTAAGPSTKEKAVNEDSPLNPITRYGKSKKAQEELVHKYMDKLPITICRPPAVFGERDTEIYLVFRTYLQGLMTMVGFDEKKVSLIHVTDLVNGLYLAAISEKSVGQTYFISSDEFYTWPQVADAIKQATGKNALRLRLPHFLVYTVAVFAEFFSMFSSKAATFNIEKARDFVQPFWTCDISKAKRELGFKQEISLEEGMKRTIDWYKQNKWL